MRVALRVIGIGLIGAGIVLGVLALLPGSKGVQEECALGAKMPVDEPKLTMSVKEKVLTGVYKAYGEEKCLVPMWLAKTVFTNGSKCGRITSLRLRYKVGQYSDWCSWHEYPAVDPTQTVVDLYHPIFTSECAKLTSETPAELQMECEYTDASGKTQKKPDNRRIQMMGRHQFIFSDLTAEERTLAFQDEDTLSALLAAWVSRQDSPVDRLASLANKFAGGVGASSSDDDCLKVMREVYELMRKINITYQHPQTLADKSMSYDIKTVQSLQYPRDTVQKKSGTCIDLAILYAAMLNSVNVRPYLVSLDGHCFPMGKTPSGQFLPVEATCVGGGGANSEGFDDAVKAGFKNWKKVNDNGRFTLIDCRECWTNGISNPELEPLPPDILEKWGILDAGGNTKVIVVKDPQKSPPAAGVPNIAGQWRCTLTAANGVATPGMFQIAVQGNQVQLVAAGASQIQGADGLMHNYSERDDFVGTFDGRTLTLTCNRAAITLDGVQIAPTGLPWRLVLTVGADGRSMQGTVSYATGQSATVAAQR
jgi:hypothetical protein